MKEQEVLKLQAILYQALASPTGLLLRTSDGPRTRQRLYEARRASADPALAVLQFRLTPQQANGVAITKGALPDTSFEQLALAPDLSTEF